MNARHAIFCTAFFCSTGTLHAQVCSGGGGGGMDVTGNDCNDSTYSLMAVMPLDTEGKGIGMPPPALKATSGDGEQISGAQAPADNDEATRLEALLMEQPLPAGTASETPGD